MPEPVTDRPTTVRSAWPLLTGGAAFLAVLYLAGASRGSASDPGAYLAALAGVGLILALVVGVVRERRAATAAAVALRRQQAALHQAASDSARRLDRLLLLESAVVHARDAIVILAPAPDHGPGRSVLYVNAAFTRMTGYTSHEVVGRSLHFLRGPKSDPATLDQLRDALDHGLPLQVELLNYRKDGSELWVELSLVPVPDPDGKVGHWVMIQRDVSDRKRAEEELREREHRLRVLGDNLPAGFVYQLILRPDGRFEFPYVSAGLEPLLGVAPVAAVAEAEAVFGLLHPEDAGRVMPVVWASARDLAPFEAEFRMLTAAGRVKWVHCRSMPGRLPDGATRWDGLLLDITNRKRAEEELKRSEERYRLLFDANPQPMWVFDETTLRFLAVNEAAVRKYGYTRDEFLGMTIRDIRPPEDVPALPEALADLGAVEAPPDPVRGRHRTKAGAALDVEIVSHRLQFDGHSAWLIQASDVTERRRLEEHLRQAQKMETVGQMAGGIAHDFNNLLTGALGSLAMVRLPADDPNRPYLATAERAAQRAAELTRKLLGFARKNQILVAPVRVDEFATEVVDLLRRTFDPRIEIVARLAGAGPVVADPTLINQALLNLCLNARDAMPAGGRLEIWAEAVAVTPAEAGRHPDGHPGSFVRVTVADTGCGIAPDIQTRLFEPFFTTKPVGQGTGLGLAMVHGIVKQHGGWVAYETEPGRGTRFDLYLPAAPTGAPSAEASGSVLRTPTDRTPEGPADVVTPPPGRERTVLLVDDEDMIRDLGRSVLEAAGYRVLEAQDGADAVELFRREHARIDLVILDLTMPRLSGRDAFRSMTTIHPDARVLFSSGYSSDDLSDVTGAVGLLAKPYRPQELVSAVRRALSAHPAVGTPAS